MFSFFVLRLIPIGPAIGRRRDRADRPCVDERGITGGGRAERDDMEAGLAGCGPGIEAMMRQYASTKFHTFMVNATSSIEQKWKVRARRTIGQGESKKAAYKRRILTGNEITEELNRLDGAKEGA